MAIDTDNNYYFLAEISGHKNSNLVDYDGQPLHTYNYSDNDRDIYVFSTDGDGNFRWDKMIGGGRIEHAASINVDAENNVYVSGTAQSRHITNPAVHFDTDTIKTEPELGVADPMNKSAFLIKYDQEGNYQWLQEPEGVNDIYYGWTNYNGLIMKTIVDSDGTSHSLIFFGPGTHLNGQLTVSGENQEEERIQQAAIVNYDADGVLEDFFTIDMKPVNGSYPYNYQLAYDTNLDRYYIADTNRKSTDTVSINGYGASNYNKGFYLAAVDNQGEVIWYMENTNGGSLALGDLQLDADGNIYLAGRYHGLEDSFAGYSFTAKDAYNAISPFLVKLDSDGNLLWGANGETYSSFPGESIAIDSSSVYLGMPSLRNQWGDFAVPGPHEQGLVPAPIIMKFNAATGEAQEVIHTPEIPSGVNGFIAIGLDHNGDLIGGGYFSNNLFYDESFALFNSGGPSDFFIAKYKPRETSCIPPKTIHIAKINETDVKIYWSPRQGETQWEVAYSNEPNTWPTDPIPNINPATQGTHVMVNDTPELILTDVSTANESKHYQVFVRPICEEGSGSWSAPAYFVLEDLSEEDCRAPQFLQLEHIDENSAEISWTPVGNETQWKVSYDIIYQGAQEEVQSIMVNGNPQVTLENLIPETEYVVFVEAVCADDDHSEKEGPLSLTTEEDMSVKKQSKHKLKIYPNPTTGIVNLQSETELKSYTLFDLQGRIVQQDELETPQLDLSKLGNGLYILRVKDQNGGVQNFKVVKE